MKTEREERKINPGDWVRAGDAIYEMMHDGWRKGEEQLRNRVSIKFEFDKTVPESEREYWMTWIERGMKEHIDARSTENVIHPKPNRYS